jgi:hypothetical protein
MIAAEPADAVETLFCCGFDEPTVSHAERALEMGVVAGLLIDRLLVTGAQDVADV